VPVICSTEGKLVGGQGIGVGGSSICREVQVWNSHLVNSPLEYSTETDDLIIQLYRV